jgi:hypothetical protein
MILTSHGFIICSDPNGAILKMVEALSRKILEKLVISSKTNLRR